VEFFHSGTKIGEDVTPPYEITWFNLPLGDLELTALATGMDGSTARSDTIRISVHPRGYAKTALTFAPTEDTYVRPKRKSRNYGERTFLQLRGTPDFYNTYLKFAVAKVSGAILSAKLRLFSLDNNETGGSLYSIPNEFINSDQSWDEAGLIAANAPLIVGNPLDSHGPVTENQWIEYDVSEGITGNGTFSFALQIDQGELEYSSKEGNHSPQLVVEFVRPLPIISSFTPSYGTPGTIVAISGANFDSTKVITFDKTPASQFEAMSDTLIHVTVPLQATSGKISVTNSEGTTSTIEDFTVLSAPIITDFIPRRGTAKSEILIFGENFTTVSQVAFSGVPTIDFAVESNSQIKVIVPEGAGTGKIEVTNQEGSSLSSENFVILLPPTIASFAPTEGAAGTWLTIAGTNFDVSTEIAFHDSVITAVEWDSTTQVRVRVPEQARMGTIRVFNGTLYAESVQPFVVLHPAIITEFSPSEGPIGTVVIFRGRNLETTTAVAFNGVAADSFTVVSGNEIQAIVPDSASTGRLSIANRDGIATSENIFTVVYPPTIISFEPLKAKVGTPVTIVGTNFETAKELTFNGIADTSFIVLSNTEIEGVVPEDATTGPIRVSNPSGSITSSQSFVVEPDLVPFVSIFTATEDSYVRSSLPQQGHGSLPELRVRTTTVAERRTYLKFNVTGLTGEVQSAKLRLLMTNVSIAAGALYSVSNHFRDITEPWTEEGLTWENAPEIAGQALNSVDSVRAPGLIEFDITSALQADGIYSFVIKNGVADMAIYSSKEGLFAPELEITSLEPGATNPPRIRSFWPQFGNHRDSIILLGSDFEEITEVSLGGVPAIFSVVSATTIEATVPADAESGEFRVSNAFGEGITADVFAVGEPDRSFALLPTDDAYVRSNKPLKNYGTFADLSVRETSSASYLAYFKFEISGVVNNPTAAMLKLHTMQPGVDGGSVYIASNDFKQSDVPWNEDELDWGNAPEIQGESLAEIGPVDSSDSVTIDLSSLVRGNGTITVALQNSSSDAVKYSSKEGIMPPELWIHTGSSTAVSKVNPQRSESFAPELVGIPKEFQLRQNYPNPFNAETVIEYALPKDSHVKLTVYNLLGQTVRTLVDGVQQAGFKRVRWNGLNGVGRELTSGVYFVQLQTPNQPLTRKIILQK
jgi:hypothetical protein